MKNDKTRIIRALDQRVMDLAYIRDGELVHTDEAVILACLLHTKGKARNSKDMEDVQRIMNDINLEPEDIRHLNRKKD